MNGTTSLPPSAYRASKGDPLSSILLYLFVQASNFISQPDSGLTDVALVRKPQARAANNR